MIPYAKQMIQEDDVSAVVAALKSGRLTQGPRVAEFEKALAARTGARHAVSFSSGTAALHGAYAAAGLGPGDEFITSPLTFAATANAGLFLGARPVFADIDPRTGNIDPREVEKKITPKTRAIVSVDYSGTPADFTPLDEIAKKNGIPLIEDACHSLGASYKGRAVGCLSDMTIFSFHPAKSITTGEGGAVLTSNDETASALRSFRQHGIVKENLPNSPGDWYQEMRTLGINGRLSDIQCALGLSQLRKLDSFMAARRRIAGRYRELLTGHAGLRLPEETPESRSSWHIYPIRVRRRNAVFAGLRSRGIGVQVHYLPVYRHPFYRSLGFAGELCPLAEAYSNDEISLPIFPDLSEPDQDRVIDAVKNLLNEFDESPAVR